MINTENIKLGKKLKVTDVRTFKLAKYLRVAAPLPSPPSEVSYVTRVPDWKMNLNDRIGDCVPAAMAHTVQQMTFFSRGLSGMIVPTDQDVLTAYQRIGGYIPGRPETDNGCDMLTALKYWRRVGIANHKILAFMEINPKNLNEVQTAIWMFGSVFTGLQLPISVQPLDQWIVPDGGTYTSIGRPGGWGGHCVPFFAGSPLTLTCVTWGMMLKSSHNFWLDYVDEAYVVLSMDWINSVTNLAVNGFNLDQLQNDLSQL